MTGGLSKEGHIFWSDNTDSPHSYFRDRLPTYSLAQKHCLKLAYYPIKSLHVSLQNNIVCSAWFVHVHVHIGHVHDVERVNRRQVKAQESVRI